MMVTLSNWIIIIENLEKSIVPFRNLLHIATLINLVMAYILNFIYLVIKY